MTPLRTPPTPIRKYGRRPFPVSYPYHRHLKGRSLSETTAKETATTAAGNTVPTDPDIPALRAIEEAGVAAVLGDLAGSRLPRVRLLKHHPGSRCTVLADLGDRRIVIKAYAEHPEALVELMRGLERVGLASGRAPTIPPLLDVRVDLNLLVTAWLDGPAGPDLLAQGRGHRAGDVAAAWLHAAADVDLELGEVLDPPSVLRDATRWVGYLARADEGLGRAAADALHVLASDPPTPGSMGTRHASFSPSHVFDLGDGPGVIDWDSFARGPLELEAGMFLASLSRLVGGRRRLGAEATEAARAFRSGTSDMVQPETLEWYRSAMLVKLAKYLSHRRPRRWRDRAAGLLAEAREVLGSP